MHALIRELIAAAPVVTDGGWGTQLQERGLPLGECPDAWNLTRPGEVEAVARAYVAAGSRVILTNTFGASRIGLARPGLADQVEALNRAGAAISRRAAGSAARVFGSMGPIVRMPGMDDLPDRERRAAFAEQAHALAGGGVEGLVIETMSGLAEAVLAVEAVRETGLPVVACMVFGVGQAGERTMTGDRSEASHPPFGGYPGAEQAAEALAAAGAAVIGANCGNGAGEMLPVCRRLRAATTLPIWMKPNAGLPEVVGGDPPSVTYGMTPEEFAAQAAALIEAGATFIGGCCGTRPAFIRALVRVLEKGASSGA